ncbi:MAG: prepilin-type N-terminal cleavage/methylation domain-containing protein [Erysipelotrichaceae bacterium]|nr:prepilin-type N-terminal cleavage/methylation domain-containing protein [Erysipelotrichaceae bacterium]
MGTVSSTEKGFSLLEMLVGLLLISSMLVLSISHVNKPQAEQYYFLNGYLLAQSQAISEKRVVTYEKGISFNSMGHIDLARTVEFGYHVYTLNLGSGYVLVK